MPETRPRVLIAGGGFAAAEAALALRALAEDRVGIDVVAPSDKLSYRPAATAEPFGDGMTLRYDLAALCSDIEARFVRDSLAAVAPAVRRVRLASHGRLDYDYLVLALGARLEIAVAGATTFRDQRDAALVRSTMLALWTGEARRVAFAVPAGTTWSLPLYELALQASAEAADQQLTADLTIVTPEKSPLEVFGRSASRLVGELLSDRGIRFVGGDAPTALTRSGALFLRSGATVAADRVIAAPRLLGPRIAGIPGSWSGFTPVDGTGRVEGLDRVYAAGDMTTFPIKQGGLAAQQADDIAHDIAGAIGAPVHELRPRRELRARLLGGDHPVVLQATLDRDGRVGDASRARLASELDPAPETKVAARYLGPYLEERPELAVL